MTEKDDFDAALKKRIEKQQALQRQAENSFDKVIQHVVNEKKKEDK